MHSFADGLYKGFRRVRGLAATQAKFLELYHLSETSFQQNHSIVLFLFLGFYKMKSDYIFGEFFLGYYLE